jgi:nicotinamidase-related amidase
MLATRSRSQLLLIDVQDKLLPAVDNGPMALAAITKLAAVAVRLAIPITISEHYPSGLGRTASALREAAGPSAEVTEKITFSCWRQDALRRRLLALRQEGRDQVAIAGLETHVCVCQTSLDLLANGFAVFLAADAITSRTAQSRTLALERLGWAGVAVASLEMIAFEWLERAGTPEFRDVFPLLK